MARKKQGEAADKVMFMGRNPLKNSLSLTVGLTDYEMLLCEPLHDVSKHIENIFEELPGHLDKEDALLFIETIEAAHGQTEVIRGVDNRMVIIKINSVLYGTKF